MGKKVIATYIGRVGYMSSVTRTGQRYRVLRVSIPARIVRKIGLSAGDYVKVSIEKIEITEFEEK